MLTTACIGLLTCLGIILSVLFFPRFRCGEIRVESYWVIAMVGACALLCFSNLSLSALGRTLMAPSEVNPLKILVLFLSMTLLSIFLDEIGFFRYVAARALHIAHNSQSRLFVVLYFTVSVLTVFTSNDIIILTFTPFLCYFAKHARIDPVPYLMAEFVAANTLSMTLIIGNPTNIYIATSYHIHFMDYLHVMFLPSIAGGVTAFGLLWIAFRKRLQQPCQGVAVEVEIPQPAYLVVGLSYLILCTLLLAIGPYLGLEMWGIALASALSLLLTVSLIAYWHHQRPVELLRSLKRVPWQLIPFVLSMFTLVFALAQQGISARLGSLIGEEQVLLRYGLASYFSANLINNIPMSVLFCTLMQELPSALIPQAAYASIVGSNLGAYLTPIGALAGILWCSLIKEQQIHFGFRAFVRYGLLISLPTLLVCLGVLYGTV